MLSAGTPTGIAAIPTSSSSSFWCEVFSQNLPPLRSSARMVYPPPVAGPRSSVSQQIWWIQVVIIILRQFLTRRNTTKVITRARINAKGDDMSQHKKNQLRAVSSEEVWLQRDFETVNRLLGADVLRQSIPLRRSGDGEWSSAELRDSPGDEEVITWCWSESPSGVDGRWPLVDHRHVSIPAMAACCLSPWCRSFQTVAVNHLNQSFCLSSLEQVCSLLPSIPTQMAPFHLYMPSTP